MAKVENFRALSLYNRSLDLALVVYQFVDNHKECLTMQEAQELRKTVVLINLKIASAIGQVNIKIRFKKLNEAKENLLQFHSKLEEAILVHGINLLDCEKVNDLSVQVLRLLHYYFGQSKERKSK